MALDPRLMMIDYSGITDAMNTIGQGQVQGLAGKAMMGDPNAMEGLQRRSPMMAAQVQQQQAEAQAKSQQAQYETDKRFAEEMKDAFKTFSNAKDPAEFSSLINQAVGKGFYPTIGARLGEGGETIDEEDYLLAKVFNGQINPETFDKTMKMRAEIKPYVQGYTDAKASLNTLLSVTQKGSTATDQLAAVFSFMKSLDPNSVVREGEQVMVKRTDGIFGVMGNMLNQLATGQALNDEQQANLQRTALSGFEGQARAIADQMKFQTETANAMGVDPSLVVPPELINIDSTIEEYKGKLNPVDATKPFSITIEGKPFTFPSRKAYDDYLNALKGDK